MNIAIIFAGGSGVRMGAGLPKQFLEVNGKPIIIHTLKLFQYHRHIDKIYISVLKDYIPYMESLIEEFKLTKVAHICFNPKNFIHLRFLIANRNEDEVRCQRLSHSLVSSIIFNEVHIFLRITECFCPIHLNKGYNFNAIKVHDDSQIRS